MSALRLRARRRALGVLGAVVLVTTVTGAAIASAQTDPVPDPTASALESPADALGGVVPGEDASSAEGAAPEPSEGTTTPSAESSSSDPLPEATTASPSPESVPSETATQPVTPDTPSPSETTSVDVATGTPTEAATPDGRTVVEVVVVLAQETSPGVVEVAGYAEVIEDGGVCVATVSGPGGTATAERSAALDASNTSCGAITVDVSGLGAGPWTVAVSYGSSLHTGATSGVEVTR